jgi:hypothetical protein
VSTTEAPPDVATVREEFERWARQENNPAGELDCVRFASVLTRYLSQPLSDSEAAWAYKHLANAFACGGQPGEAVRVHEAFEQWLPGKSPQLSARPPHYYPATDDPEAGVSCVESMGPDEIRLQFLAQSVQFATSYGAVGRYDDYVAKADAALAALAPANDKLELRFFSVVIFMDAAQLAGDVDRAEQRILQAKAIAEHAGDPEQAAKLRAFTVFSEIQLARQREDRVRCREKLRQALSLVEELENNQPSKQEWWRWYREGLVDYATWCNADYS